MTSSPVPAAVGRHPWGWLPVVLGAGVVAGIVLRVAVYRSSLGVLDGDEEDIGSDPANTASAPTRAP